MKSEFCAVYFLFRKDHNKIRFITHLPAVSVAGGLIFLYYILIFMNTKNRSNTPFGLLIFLSCQYFFYHFVSGLVRQ